MFAHGVVGPVVGQTHAVELIDERVHIGRTIVRRRVVDDADCDRRKRAEAEAGRGQIARLTSWLAVGIKTFSCVLKTFPKISVFWRLMCSRGIRVLLRQCSCVI